MPPKFFGMFEHSLDGKGRLILPARYRANFGASAFVSKHVDGCLAIWSPEEFDRRSDEMAVMMDGSPEERQQARAWSMGAAEVDLDRTGRVAIPSYLRNYARLEEAETVLIHGAIHHIELWNPSQWEQKGAPGDAKLQEGQSPTRPAATAPAGAGAPVTAGSGV